MWVHVVPDKVSRRYFQTYYPLYFSRRTILAIVLGGSALLAQTSPPVDGARKVATNTATGGGSCITYGNTTSWRSNAGRGLNRTFGDQYVEWYTELDSTACKALQLPASPSPTTVSPFPLAVRVTVHDYQDQAESIEVPFPPEQETTVDFLIDRNEKATIYGRVKVSRDVVKESNYTAVRAQVVVGQEGQTLIKSLQDSQIDDPAFCKHYAFERFTGEMTRYNRSTGSSPEYVPDLSLRDCLSARATAMAERFMNEHAEVASGNAVPTFENVNSVIENSGAKRRFTLAEWVVTGTTNQAMHVSGSGQPDHNEVNLYQFTCTVSMDTPLLVPKGQTLAGKHSANDSYVTCNEQRTK